jgi:Co/Zn/Cd efflux system component
MRNQYNPESARMLASTENPMLSTADTNEILLFQKKDDPDSATPVIAPVKSRSRTNQNILIFTSVAFFLFVVAEVVGALVSGSLSLLGDAFAMSIDVFSVNFLSPFLSRESI